MKGGKIPDVFATRDENVHRQMRKPVANLYSIANLISFEPLIVSTIEYFFSRLDELYVDTSKSFDLCDWLQLFTFDVMGEVTFSRRFGFLERGGDIEGVMGNIWKFFQVAAAVSLLLLSLRTFCWPIAYTRCRTRRCRGSTNSRKRTHLFRSAR